MRATAEFQSGLSLQSEECRSDEFALISRHRLLLDL